MYFPFLFLLIYLFLAKNKIMIIKQWLMLVLFALLIISPWAVRNYLITGRLILLEDYQKAALWFATNPDDIHDWDNEQIQQIIKGKTTEEYQELMHREGKRYLREHPFLYLKNSFKRFFRLWVSGHSNIFSGLERSFSFTWKTKDFKTLIIKSAFLIINIFLVIMGFWGIFLIREKIKDFIIVLSPVIYLTLLHTFTVAAPRLQIPALPFLLIFSSYAMVYLKEKIFIHHLKNEV
jgi:hypothetical protein